MSGDIIRVVLADDHAVVRAGLRAVLSVARDIEVIGEAKNGREAVAMVWAMAAIHWSRSFTVPIACAAARSAS